MCIRDSILLGKSLALNVRRQSEDVTSDDRLFQILAAAMGNTWSLQEQTRLTTDRISIELTTNSVEILNE